MTAVINQKFVTVDFSTSSAVSDSFGVIGQIPNYIQFPSVWDSTAGPGVISFQGSVDGSTFADLYTPAGAEVTVPAFQGWKIPLDPSIFSSVNYLRVRSGISSAEVIQSKARTIGIGLGRYVTDSGSGGNSLTQLQTPTFSARKTIFS